MSLKMKKRQTERETMTDRVLEVVVVIDEISCTEKTQNPERKTRKEKYAMRF